jgi:hypothetical protein
LALYQAEPVLMEITNTKLICNIASFFIYILHSFIQYNDALKGKLRWYQNFLQKCLYEM